MATSPPRIDWKHATRLVDAARRIFDVHRERLRELIAESNKLLHPLRDPLLTDFGVNRWLSNQREEAWSDWLEWVVCQMNTPAAAYDLFGLPFPDCLQRMRNVAIATQREVSILKGHINRRGRLDLVIRFGTLAMIVVEVKVTDADGSDTGKHAGYNEWVTEQFGIEVMPVVLAIHGTQESYNGFHLVRWRTVSQKLRSHLLNADIDDFVVQALLCGFIGAVEQRLLGFRTETVRHILHEKLPTFDTSVIHYLEECLGKEPTNVTQ